MFVGRSTLATRVEQLVLVDGDPQGERPVLVVEGYGGSGRTAFLRTQWSRWKEHTPTVWVDCRLVDDPNVNSLRPLLAAVMQGLSEKVGSYEVKFPRVVLAHIAMESAVAEVEPERAKQAMRTRLSQYRDRDLIITLLEGLLQSAGEAVAPSVPGVDAVSRAVAQSIVDRLRRSTGLAKFSWDDALAWFAHQDNGMRFDPVAALVQLSKQAQIDNPAVRGDVDDLLVAALLADVRESLARVTGRPWNAVVLLDEGDTPTARSFVTAMLRMRRSRANRAINRSAVPTDPLAVVVTSRGRLAHDLPGNNDRMWLSAALAELTEQDVHDLVRPHIWPPELGTRRVAGAVHRLTDGHAAATDVVLRALESTPQLIDRLDEVLATPGATAQQTVAEELLARSVKGLGPVDDVVGHLVTLSAARDQSEAGRLWEMLDERDGPDELMTSTTLWAVRAPGVSATLPKFVRYLGLRALAARGNGLEWVTVFTALRDRAARDGDLGGRLHHELALGNTALVAEELSGLIATLPDHRWLALLDEMTATPSPARHAVLDVDGHDPVRRLVVVLRALNDPQVSDQGELCQLYLLAENDFRSLAGSSGTFLLRARHYRALADRLC